MSELGRAQVTIGANTKELDQGLGRAEKGMGSFAKRIPAVAGAVAALAGAAGFGALVKSAFSAQDALAKKGDTLGIVNERMAGLKLAADRAGLSQQKVEKAINATSQRVSEAAQGTGEAVKALDALGMSAADLNRMAPDERFAAITSELNKMENAGDRARVAGDIFGRNNVDMIRLTGEAIDEATQRAEAYGTALSRTDAAKIEDANDAFTEAKTAIQGVATTVAVQLAPMFRTVMQGFANMMARMNGFQGTISTVFSVARKAAEVFASAFGEIFRGLRLAAKAYEIAIRTVFTNIVETFPRATEAVIGFANTAIRNINRVIDGMNKLPFSDIGHIAEINLGEEGVTGLARRMREGLDEANASLHRMANEERPTDKVKRFFAESEDAANRSAQAIADAAQDKLQAFDEVEDRQREIAEAERARLDAQLADLDDHLMSRQERETQAFEQRIAQARELHEAGRIDSERYNAIAIQMAKDHADSLYAIEEQSAKDVAEVEELSNREKLERMSSTFGGLSSLMQSESKAMFNVGKAFAIADAGVQASLAAMRGFTAMAPFGPVAQGLAVAAAATMGANTIRNISGQQFGGGTARPSIPTTPSGNAVQVDPIQRQSQSEGGSSTSSHSGGSGTKTVNIQAQGLTAQMYRQFARELNKELAPHTRLQVTG